MNYVEQDCTFTHEGHSFTAGGALVNANFAVAYLGRDKDSDKLILTDWHGKTLSDRVTITSSWPNRNSALSSRMYQVEAWIDGVLFSGRTLGVGMSWRGKRKVSR
jgi:hypothetical protein